MKKIILLLSITTVLFACGKDKNGSINGNITNLPEGTQVFLDFLTATNAVPKDTAIVDTEGNYSFDCKIEEEGYYRLKVNNQNFITLVLQKGDLPVVNGDGNNLMDTYTIEGSSESAKLKNFNELFKAFSLKRDSVQQVAQQNQGNGELLNGLQQLLETSGKKLTGQIIQLIDEDPSSLVTIQLINYLNPEDHMDKYEKVDEALAQKMPNSDYYTTFHNQLEKIVEEINIKKNTLLIGSVVPEITLSDVNGTPVSLSSLRGKVVLIDFWASWCMPCRKENPNVVAAYNKYQKQGFEVFSVSLDGLPQQKDPKKDWLSAIAADGLVWNNHVSDLQGWNSPILPSFGVQSIPFTVLIDQEGNVLGKNIRGEALHQKLAELFNN